MAVIGRLLVLVVVAFAVLSACSSSSDDPTPTVEATRDCGTGHPGLPPAPSKVLDVEEGTEFVFDAEFMCSGAVQGIDLPNGAYVLVTVRGVTRGPQIATGDQLVVWTSLSMTPAVATVPATGNLVQFEATWQAIPCFGRCPAIVAHKMTPLLGEAPD